MIETSKANGERSCEKKSTKEQKKKKKEKKNPSL